MEHVFSIKSPVTQMVHFGKLSFYIGAKHSGITSTTKMFFFFFFFFEGIQFLAFLANQYKNLENSKTLSSFLKYSPNIFSQNFAVRKTVKRKFIPVLFSWYFFHYVNNRYTMRYYTQKYIKTFWNNETIKYKH